MYTMASQWSHMKERATSMRKRGTSIRAIEAKLGVPKSTLSYWLKDIPLADYQRRDLERRNRLGLVKARKEAVKWHNAQKAARLEKASSEAAQTLQMIDISNDAIAELALAFLYLGEGMKAHRTAMGNSDPVLLRFFVNMLRRIYNVPTQEMKCELHLRADQDPKSAITFWAGALDIPTINFGRPIIDIRTRGRSTYAHYKGVCVVRCSRVAIQRKLGYIASNFCQQAAGIMRG